MAIATRAPEIDLAHCLEVRTAERDRAWHVLDRLFTLIDDHACWSHEQQQIIREARSTLEDAGLRAGPEQTVWTNRT